MNSQIQQGFQLKFLIVSFTTNFYPKASGFSLFSLKEVDLVLAFKIMHYHHLNVFQKEQVHKDL